MKGMVAFLATCIDEPWSFGIVSVSSSREILHREATNERRKANFHGR